MIALIVFVALVSTGAYIASTEARAAEPSLPATGRVESMCGQRARDVPDKFALDSAEAVGPTFKPGEGKRELPSFGDVRPSPRFASLDRGRYQTPTRRDGVKPFQPHRVSPDESLVAPRPKTVDELRTLSNPKSVSCAVSSAAPALESVIARSAVASNTGSRRVLCPTERVQSAMAAVPRESFDRRTAIQTPERSCARDAVEDRFPAAFRAGPGADVRAELYTQNSRHATCSHGPSNAGAFGSSRDRNRDLGAFDAECLRPADVDPDRLGAAFASSMGVRGSSRDASSAPDPTGKELTLGSARMYGSLQMVNPSKAETYDPRNQMRTTLKETSVHDTTDGFIGGAGALTVARSDDACARTTLRQTLPEPEETRSLDATNVVHKAPVYDPNDIFRTTARETTEVDGRVGQVGTLASESGGPVHSLDATLRSTTSRGRFGGPSDARADGYAVARVEAPPTTRHSTLTEHTGPAASSVRRHVDTSAIHRAVGNAKESLLEGRVPNAKRYRLAPRSDGVHRAPNPAVYGPRTSQPESKYLSQRPAPAISCGRMRVGASSDRTPDPCLVNQLRHNPLSSSVGTAFAEHGA